ncbi:SRPBCC domain-containing protein [Actinocatenispora comari]|uniref:ArsR family transcriptional regulator n=1 Tax=Actinocatenispora comari TaxID=2807577 RepID=A0A8J4AEH4_9ACTN|nr:SRPBCC domain-containing protein [Actinocatenispora comari]GIL28212.1 ArsR family transcriptional regulator [Actinocatenispora comari]
MTPAADSAGEPVDIQRALAAVGEPTRYRIVELLAARARTVGEVTEAIGALQPQTTKHLQTLAAAGVVRLHKLGRRRVARLDRATLQRVAEHFSRLAESDPDDDVLDRYEAAIATETARAPGERVLRLHRTVRASAATVWAAWTQPQQAARWWAPRHFAVETFDLAPRAGAPIRLVLREGDHARYESVGRVIEADVDRRLVFSLAPVDQAGTPLFSAEHTVDIHQNRTGTTTVTLLIRVSDVSPEAAPAVAGLEPGWTQLLDALVSLVQSEDHP